MTFAVAKKVLALFGLAVATLLAGTALYLLFSPGPRTGGQDLAFVTIEPNETAPAIAAKLADAGLIKQRRTFLWAARLLGIDRTFKTGRYKFRTGSSLWTILRGFQRGEGAQMTVTIPEGSSVRQIAGLLDREVGIDSAHFVAEADSPRTILVLNLTVKRAEGFLYPNTYKFYWRIDPEIAINEMLAEFQRRFDSILVARAAQVDLTVPEVVTLASLVEAEAGLSSERKTIAAVFHRRLKLGMPLQCDPTVIYAIGEKRRSLSRDDLQFESPYNTYLHPGLPPGPIGNPGRASVVAVLWPDTTRYLYFVARGDGSHIFSYDLEGHNRARYQIQREQDALRDSLKKAALGARIETAVKSSSP